MEFLKKQSASQTTQSFSQRVPLGQKNSQNLPFVSQIQELMAILVQKKSELKQAKLKQGNLLGKQEQQQVRIGKIKISMDHEIEKEQILRAQQDKIQQEISIARQSIKELTKCVKTTKSELAQILQQIIAGKKSKTQLENVCSQLQFLIQARTNQNVKLDDQIQNLQTLILASQNDVRNKHDELTNLKIQRTQLLSLINFLEQKYKLTLRAKNASICQSHQLTQSTIKSQQKIQNLKRQQSQTQWSCQQIRSQNCQIQQLNQRLLIDLQGVRKHLAMMQKMNGLLQNSLEQYGMTGDKVSRMINSAKSY